MYYLLMVILAMLDPLTSTGYWNSVGMGFTAKDHDIDNHNSNCAVTFKGAWWYNGCLHINPNGQYLGGVHSSVGDGIDWKEAKGFKYSMKTSILKVRRHN